MKKPVALVILDGWGNSNQVEGNAIKAAHTPNFDKYASENSSTFVAASGLDVGLPDGQMGNSEVGHLNIGAGRIIYQELTRITKSIKDGDFFVKEEFLVAVKHAKENGKKLHILGLLSDGGVHSHINHVKGLLDLANKHDLNEVYLHAFLDGRDTPPKSALNYVKEIESYMNEINVGSVATISGRYYAMDRDNRWERVELAYNTLVKGEGETAKSAVEAIENSYSKDVCDEFVLPTSILDENEKAIKIEEDDSVIFFNFRPDRAREITRAIVDEKFTGFNRDYFKTTYVCMTMYDVTIPNVIVAFKPQSIQMTLGEYVAKLGKKQLRIAETEKYAHVTFFFNGGVEEANDGEDRELIPSPKVATYDLQPEMSAHEVTERLLEKLSEGEYELIILNYANPDMVGHTGDFKAAVKAVETVDGCLGQIIEKIKEVGGSALITADHGNAETMIDIKTHSVMTAHTTNAVPLVLVGSEKVLKDGGKLCDIAPTLLELMDENQPEEMTGNSLLK